MVVVYATKVLKEGDTAVFSCKVDGYPTIKCKWIINGRSVFENRLDFTIENVGRKDAGVYKCIAENSYGRKTSYPAKVEVYCK